MYWGWWVAYRLAAISSPLRCTRKEPYFGQNAAVTHLSSSEMGLGSAFAANGLGWVG
jgi:hypothetical protein